VREGRVESLHIEQVNGEWAPTAELAPLLEAAGFRPTPQGFRLRA
jgi:ATP-dependent Lhr-like helicase